MTNLADFIQEKSKALYFDCLQHKNISLLLFSGHKVGISTTGAYFAGEFIKSGRFENLLYLKSSGVFNSFRVKRQLMVLNEAKEDDFVVIEILSELEPDFTVGSYYRELFESIISYIEESNSCAIILLRNVSIDPLKTELLNNAK